MRATKLITLFCFACAITGCARKEQVQTLDEAIDALPDEWGPYSDHVEQVAKKFGYTVMNYASSTNNYAMLNRVIALTNVKERIRLTWKLYNHFRRTPEWYVEHREGGFNNRYRHDFFGNCASMLMCSTNATPETIIEGWKMEAETIRDQVQLIRQTGPEWQARMQKRYEEKEAARYAEFKRRLKAHGSGVSSHLSQKEAPEIGYARDVRWRLKRYFMYEFSGDAYYRKLPDEMKPVFIEQMKRDFFIYSDVTNAFTWKDFPPELKKAYLDVHKQMETK